jgi:hypothetical protein
MATFMDRVNTWRSRAQQAEAEIERQQADIDKLLAERQGWLDEIEGLREELRVVLAHVLDLRGALAGKVPTEIGWLASGLRHARAGKDTA